MNLSSTMKSLIFASVILNSFSPFVEGKGIMLLYQPIDISNECVFSTSLRYDLSFGMGLSDTISLLFRTIEGVDYQCRVDIVTEHSEEVFLILVIKYPNPVTLSCSMNQNAFAIYKKRHCIRLCDSVDDNFVGRLMVLFMQGRVRFRFVSNSSLNTEINAHSYLVTATSARVMPEKQRCSANETSCSIMSKKFCFTGGVACDGIENCGVAAWHDERVSECVKKRDSLSIAPIIAVIALVACALITVTHIVYKCVPAVAGTFFILNANEDNRFCLNPVFKTPEGAMVEQKIRKKSLIPTIDSNSSSDSSCDESVSPHAHRPVKQRDHDEQAGKSDTDSERRSFIWEVLTGRINDRLLLAGRSGNTQPTQPTTDLSHSSDTEPPDDTKLSPEPSTSNDNVT